MLLRPWQSPAAAAQLSCRPCPCQQAPTAQMFPGATVMLLMRRSRLWWCVWWRRRWRLTMARQHATSQVPILSSLSCSLCLSCGDAGWPWGCCSCGSGLGGCKISAPEWKLDASTNCALARCAVPPPAKRERSLADVMADALPSPPPAAKSAGRATPVSPAVTPGWKAAGK